jgi:hypothetical protein
LRQILDSNVYDNKKILTASDTISYKKEIDKLLADKIRQEIASSAPDLAKLNKEYTFYKRM